MGFVVKTMLIPIFMLGFAMNVVDESKQTCDPTNVPQWLQDKINVYQTYSSAYSSEEIEKIMHDPTLPIPDISDIPKKITCSKYKEGWRYKVLYFIDPGCCDQFSWTLNYKGNALCMGGGFTGEGDGRCEKVFASLKYIGPSITIWENTRNY